MGKTKAIRNSANCPKCGTSIVGKWHMGEYGPEDYRKPEVFCGTHTTSTSNNEHFHFYCSCGYDFIKDI